MEMPVSSSGTPHTTGLVRWLMFVALLVFAMVVVGGITRLTESGLSITEWKPVTGTLPPLNEAAWLDAFEKYKAIPEYTEINGPAGMTLSQFKFIFFWEWAHRLLGRVVGMALLLPWLYFAVCGTLRRTLPANLADMPGVSYLVTSRLPPSYFGRIFALGMLVALQGTIGWWMVSSGLSQRTDVSHFRLAVHLLTALFILAGLIWTALDAHGLQRRRAKAKLTGYGAAIGAIVFVQLLFGAWVAGLNAGSVANTWPLMNDHFVPEGIDGSNGALFAVMNDPYLIHFIHRWWAWVAVGALILLARRVKIAGTRSASIAIHSAYGIQILLGIATVMTGVNISLAVAHQAIGAILVAATAWGIHVIGRAEIQNR